MEGKRRVMVQQHDDEMGEIKKGPWKEEEDQILIKHVNKYGPRDWSSIRSKGLLRRTGKSCRLRWVNKLRPHLKTGVKFSAEEERIVIDLQAQFGNKWARIATYLTGRTDNDVKNFWSSRQKRLARILHTSTPPPSSTTTTNPHNDTTQPETPAFHLLPSFPATHEESVAKSQSFQEDLFYPGPLVYGDTPLQLEKKPFSEQQSDLPLQLDSQDLINKLGDPGFLDDFHNSSESVLATTELPIMPSFFGPDRICEITGRPESSDAAAINCMIDDFPPIDMFDHIEPLPSPSQWS